MTSPDIRSAGRGGERTLSGQRGSALSEVILLMFVLAPLLYAVVVVGKFVDIRQQSVVGARYLAWENTVGSQATDVVASLTQFLDSNAPDNATPPAADRSQSDLPERQMVRPFRYRENTALPASTQVTLGSLGVRAEIGNSLDATVTPAMGVDAIIGTLSGDAGISSSDEGVVQATLDVGIDDHPWLGNWLAGCAGGKEGNACLSESSSVYVDDWSAVDDDMAIERIQEMVPATTLQPLGETLSLLGRLPLFEELAPLDTAFGHVDMSVLPKTRERLNGVPGADSQPGAASLERRSVNGATR